MTIKFQRAVPTAGNTVVALDATECLTLNPVGTLATLTVQMPKQPVHGQPFALISTQIVTALTLQVGSGSGHTSVGTLSALAVLGRSQWVFDSTNATWYPA